MLEYQVNQLSSIPQESLKIIPFNPIHVVIHSAEEMRELTTFLKSDQSNIRHLSLELSHIKQNNNSFYLDYFKKIKGIEWFFEYYGSFSDFFYTCKVLGDFLEQDTKLTYLKIGNINQGLCDHYFRGEGVGEKLENYVKNIFEKNTSLKMLEVTDKGLAQAFHDDLDFSLFNSGLYVVNFHKGHQTLEEQLEKRTPHNIKTRVLEIFKKSASTPYNEDLHETLYFLTQSIEGWISITGKQALKKFLPQNEHVKDFKKEDFSFKRFTINKVERPIEEPKPKQPDPLEQLEKDWTCIL